MEFAGAIGLTVGIIAVAFHYWEEIFSDRTPAPTRDFILWTFKGMGFPLLAWTLFNLGLSPRLPALMSKEQFPTAIAIISTYWMAATFGWLATFIYLNARNRGDFKSMGILLVILLSLVAGPILFLLGKEGAGAALSIWLVAITHFTVSLLPSPKPKTPMYSRAVAKMKFGKYDEAELEVINELEKHEDDFDGWMMLAELYARQFRDLPEADSSVRGLCSQPNVTGAQAALALNRLADWHLQLGHDPVAARSALDEIIRKTPDSHFARMARQRIDQLPSSKEELIEQQKPKPIRLPALSDALDDSPVAAPRTEMSRTEAAALANKYSEKLKLNPNDIAARENLARTLAESLGKIDLAVDQLELLIAMPDPPAKKVAEWLSLIAAWRLQYQQNRTAARKYLEKLVREYPQTPQAFAAQRRLNLMEMDERMQRAAAAGKSGNASPA